MKRSGPLLILVALILATLSYGGKQAEYRPQGNFRPQARSQEQLTMERSPAAEVQKPSVFRIQKRTQDPVVIAEFPRDDAPLEVEEIH